jgi:hypothetical protein
MWQRSRNVILKMFFVAVEEKKTEKSILRLQAAVPPLSSTSSTHLDGALARPKLLKVI